MCSKNSSIPLGDCTHRTLPGLSAKFWNRCGRPFGSSANVPGLALKISPPHSISNLAFEDVERLILAVMDVLRCPMMRRHDPLSERIATLGVFADCLIGKHDPLYVQAHNIVGEAMPSDED